MAKPAVRVSAGEYLRQERARVDGRAELLDGELVMMAGASRRHNRLTRNILTALDRRLGEGPCEALAMDMRVKPETADTYTYPDVVVLCAEADFEDEEEDTLTNPVAIFEVLSPSTRSRDRDDKFAYYRTIASLRHYVLVETDRRLVDHYARQEGDVWLLRSYEADDAMRLDPTGVELPLAEIYRQVERQGPEKNGGPLSSEWGPPESLVAIAFRAGADAAFEDAEGGGAEGDGRECREHAVTSYMGRTALSDLYAARPRGGATTLIEPFRGPRFGPSAPFSISC